MLEKRGVGFFPVFGFLHACDILEMGLKSNHKIHLHFVHIPSLKMNFMYFFDS